MNTEWQIVEDFYAAVELASRGNGEIKASMRFDAIVTPLGAYFLTHAVTDILSTLPVEQLLLEGTMQAMVPALLFGLWHDKLKEIESLPAIRKKLTPRSWNPPQP